MWYIGWAVKRECRILHHFLPSPLLLPHFPPFYRLLDLKRKKKHGNERKKKRKIHVKLTFPCRPCGYPDLLWIEFQMAVPFLSRIVPCMFEKGNQRTESPPFQMDPYPWRSYFSYRRSKTRRLWEEGRWLGEIEKKKNWKREMTRRRRGRDKDRNKHTQTDWQRLTGI